MSAPPVQFRDLKVHYDQQVILHGISASIDKGQCVAITGENGSGKSTLLKTLLGIVPVGAGEVSLFGTKLRQGRKPDPSIQWGRIGYVPQHSTVGGGIGSTVQEVVSSGTLGSKHWHLSRKDREKVDAALNDVGLVHRRKEAFQVLSGGQQQRVLIARAMVRDPDLLLLDEPFTGLDKHNRLILAQLVRKHKDSGGTTMVVLHELGELAPLIDRELLIQAGHIVHDGPCTHETHDDHVHHHSPEQPISRLYP